jgi:hypothetical protein
MTVYTTRRYNTAVQPTQLCSTGSVVPRPTVNSGFPSNNAWITSSSRLLHRCGLARDFVRYSTSPCCCRYTPSGPAANSFFSASSALPHCEKGTVPPFTDVRLGRTASGEHGQMCPQSSFFVFSEWQLERNRCRVPACGASQSFEPREDATPVEREHASARTLGVWRVCGLGRRKGEKKGSGGRGTGKREKRRPNLRRGLHAAPAH